MRKPPLILMLLLIGWWCFLLLMTHLPKPPPIGPDVGDKTAHLMAYGTLGLLLYLNLRVRGFSPSRAVAVAIAIVMVGGAVDEWTQPLTGRSCDLLDWCSDVAGAASAAEGMAVLDWLSFGRIRVEA